MQIYTTLHCDLLHYIHTRTRTVLLISPISAVEFSITDRPLGGPSRASNALLLHAGVDRPNR